MLSYASKGSDKDAPTVLYLHGLGMAAWSWEPVDAALPEFGALVPDLPGHGRSNSIAWRSISETAGLVAAVVDTLPMDRYLHLTGHSLGAYVGLVLLTLRPKRFNTALLSGFHIGSLSYPALLKLAYLTNELVFRVPFLQRRFSSVFSDETVAERFVEGVSIIKPGTIRRAGWQVIDFEMPEIPPSFTLPILAVAADGEPDGIRKAPAALGKLFPNVQERVLENRDHL